MDEQIEEPALLGAVARAGETAPTHDQLKRWRRAGLIPRPNVEHSPGVRGSQTWYPEWAAEQLLAVVRAHRSTRRLQDLCLAVWWEGHWVRPSALREALIAPLERLSREARLLRGEESDPYEAADAIVATVRDDAMPSPTSTLFRKRLNGPADFMDLLWTFVVLGLGGQAPWEQEDRSAPDPAPGALKLISAATGADRAMSDDPVGEGPWVPTDFDLPAFIEELRDAKGFEIEDMARPIQEASDNELEQARQDALLFSGPLAMIGSVLGELLGDDIAGLGSLSVFESTAPSDLPALIRNMLILRKLAGDDAFLAIAQLVEQVNARFAAIAELLAALPEHRDLLRLDFADRLTALPPAEADRVREDVASYLRTHPQVAAALNDEDGDNSHQY